jgi:hypothetical protein
MSGGDGTDLPEVVRAALLAVRPEVNAGITRRLGLRRVLAAVLGAEAAPPAIGRFLIEEKVGTGGMGVVYRARDPESDRPSARKLSIELAHRRNVRWVRSSA